MSDIAKQSVAAAKWGALAAASKFLMQLAVNIIVARLLGPDSYGLFALATLALLLATFFSEFGLGWSLMQRADIDDLAVRFVFTWQCISGLLGTLILLVGAPLMATFLRDPRLVDVIRCLSLVCVLNAMASTANNLLRRELRFKDIAAQQIQSYAMAYLLVGIPLAALGHGAWSLVAAWLTQALLGVVLAMRSRPHAMRPLFRVAAPREYVNIGAVVFVTNICNWLVSNVDRLLIGRLLGTQPAGLYAVGYNLATVPNGLMISALQPAFLASGARLQEQLPTLRKAYIEVQSFIWLFIAPVFVAGALSSQELIRLLYGPNWGDSGLVLGLLFLAMPAYLAWALSTPILWNTGRRHLESLLQLPLLGLAVLSFVLASSHGLVAMAGVAAAVFLLRFLVIAGPACVALAVPGVELRRLLWRVLLLNGAVMAAGYAAGLALSHWTTAPLALLLARSGVAASVALLLWLSVPNLVGAPVLGLLGRFIPRQSRLARHFAAQVERMNKKEAG
ncbi:polysaccharide biosynthesis protein [Paucibacter aquatile]|uniref:Polysaccharide biosynthesis protein n=1 Tax=Kinneretia aquatilis TaxID=2070761 RepID=A0A2N8KW32_9BURK|nr:oligosaccharide flippase family protein [Paucibacter aquatile]PND37657.1 polysaccharide biosynthesis protein [Paucibacter aquatile]